MPHQSGFICIGAWNVFHQIGKCMAAGIRRPPLDAKPLHQRAEYVIAKHSFCHHLPGFQAWKKIRRRIFCALLNNWHDFRRNGDCAILAGFGFNAAAEAAVYWIEILFR